MFHEVSINSYSIDAIFGEDSATFSQPEIIGLDQSLLKHLVLFFYGLISIDTPFENSQTKTNYHKKLPKKNEFHVSYAHQTHFIGHKQLIEVPYKSKTRVDNL